MPKPTVGEHARPVEHTITSQDTLRYATELMELHGVRHLPVVDDGRLVGLISASDLFAVNALLDVDPDRYEVHMAMSRDLCRVRPDETLARAAQMMSDRRIGSCLVGSPEDGLSIFTASDACRCLAEILSE